MPPYARKLLIIDHSSPNQQHLQYETNRQGTIYENNEARKKYSQDISSQE
jgi:hypothetical protein